MDKPQDQREYVIYTCYPIEECGFSVRSHNEEEVVDMAVIHAEKGHKMRVSRAGVKGLIKKG
ncbi:MAG: DUF1059 domain-containing protein [Euryarchaeota archaeon]|nr:DUF1059 domain-containing protein [Euryarchaeota archaeon]